jgi:hypothetical protein
LSACGSSALYASTTGGDSVSAFTWTFRPEAGRNCVLTVYVPDAPQAAGNAPYRFNTDPQDPSRGRVVIVDQPAHRGQWVDLARLDPTPHPLQVTLNGASYPADAGSYTVAVSAARLSCR